MKKPNISKALQKAFDRVKRTMSDAEDVWNHQVMVAEDLRDDCERRDIKAVRMPWYKDADVLKFLKLDEPDDLAFQMRLELDGPDQIFEMQQFLTFLTRDFLAQQGIKVTLVPFNAVKYFDWLTANKLEANAASRAQFIGGDSGEIVCDVFNLRAVPVRKLPKLSMRKIFDEIRRGRRRTVRRGKLQRAPRR